MTRDELIGALKRILEGFEGVPMGQCSTLPLRLALEDIATYVGGEVEHLACRIEQEWEARNPLAAAAPDENEGR